MYTSHIARRFKLACTFEPSLWFKVQCDLNLPIAAKSRMTASAFITGHDWPQNAEVKI
jgi:hypothetical protein